MNDIQTELLDELNNIIFYKKFKLQYENKKSEQINNKNYNKNYIKKYDTLMKICERN